MLYMFTYFRVCIRLVFICSSLHARHAPPVGYHRPLRYPLVLRALQLRPRRGAGLGWSALGLTSAAVSSGVDRVGITGKMTTWKIWKTCIMHGVAKVSQYCLRWWESVLTMLMEASSPAGCPHETDNVLPQICKKDLLSAEQVVLGKASILETPCFLSLSDTHHIGIILHWKPKHKA